jgi:hypothetical protein
VLFNILDAGGLAETGNVAVGPLGVFFFIPPLWLRLAAPLPEGIDNAANVGFRLGVADTCLLM